MNHLSLKGSPALLAHVVAIATVCVWGTTFVSTKCLLQAGLDVAEIFLLRFVIAYLCTWLISPRKLWADSVGDELVFLALGVTGGSLYFVTENMAVGLTHVNNVAFIVCTAPLLTVLLAAAFTHSVRLSRRLIFGSALALVGVAVVIFNGHFVLRLSPAGDLLALAAALAWAVYSILIKRVSGRYGAVFVTRKVFIYGILTILPYFLFRPWTATPAMFVTPLVWCNLLFLGLVASFVCFVVWSWCIGRIGALKTSNYVYLNPITTVVASAIFLDEPMTVLAYLGSALILVGVAVANSVSIDK